LLLMLSDAALVIGVLMLALNCFHCPFAGLSTTG